MINHLKLNRQHTQLCRIFILVAISIALVASTFGCKIADSIILYYNDMKCNDLAENLGLKQIPPKGNSNLCHLEAKSSLLAICGETYSDYEVMADQVDGYGLFPSWKSLDLSKLNNSCVTSNQSSQEDAVKCKAMLGQFENSLRSLDKSKLRGGATIVTISFRHNRFEKKVFNWNIKSIQRVSFLTVPDQVYSDDSPKPCLYSGEADFTSIAFPIVDAK